MVGCQVTRCCGEVPWRELVSTLPGGLRSVAPNPDDCCHSMNTSSRTSCKLASEHPVPERPRLATLLSTLLDVPCQAHVSLSIWRRDALGSRGSQHSHDFPRWLLPLGCVQSSLRAWLQHHPVAEWGVFGQLYSPGIRSAEIWLYDFF